MEMTGRVILITGATSGIGRATALHLGELGARLVLGARSEARGQALQSELRSMGCEALFVPVDVTQESSVQALVNRAVEHFGGLDGAFNSAGSYVREAPLHDQDASEWDAVISVMLNGVRLSMKHEIRAMLAQSGEQNRMIVNNASVVGLRGSVSSGAAYTAAKHGVIGLTRHAAQNYVGSGIRVNAICTAPSRTGSTQPYLPEDANLLKASISKLNPTGELVPLAEIAATVAFLCSGVAGMINGETIALDGGQLARL